MKTNRPITTLFLIQSLDGKISTGIGDRDFDLDAEKINIGRGIRQYYEYEQTTDLHSMISGKVMAKMGINKPQKIKKAPVSFIVADNSNLTKTGVENMCDKSAVLFLATANRDHPAFDVKRDNLKIIAYRDQIDFVDLFSRLKQDYKIKRITIQTGGTLNAIFVREGLIDFVDIFISPNLFGGKDTPTLIDGQSLKTEKDLRFIKKLALLEVVKLKDSFIRIKYKVRN